MPPHCRSHTWLHRLLCSVAPLLVLQAPAAADRAALEVDCDTLRAVYQRLADDPQLAPARQYVARAMVLLPDCVPAQARLEQARTLDGLPLLRPGAWDGLQPEREEAP